MKRYLRGKAMGISGEHPGGLHVAERENHILDVKNCGIEQKTLHTFRIAGNAIGRHASKVTRMESWIKSQ